MVPLLHYILGYILLEFQHHPKRKSIMEIFRHSKTFFNYEELEGYLSFGVKW